MIDLTQNWIQIPCLVVGYSNYYTRVFSELAWGCNWILFMHGIFSPICLIHLIGWQSLHFEKKIVWNLCVMWLLPIRIWNLLSSPNSLLVIVETFFIFLPLHFTDECFKRCKQSNFPYLKVSSFPRTITKVSGCMAKRLGDKIQQRIFLETKLLSK